MKEIILCYQGEMALKGLNRATFEAVLSKALRYRVRELGRFQVYKAQSTMYVEPRDQEAEANVGEAYERVRKVFGLAALSRAAVCEKNFEAIQAAAEEYLGGALQKARTFKVEAKRSDKSFPMKSPELCRELGGFLLAKHPHLRVDVKHPELTVMVEVRDYGAYIHGPKTPGAGGLPVGTSGRAINMLSGGIDSPVAAWFMARRGLALHHIHFASPPYTSEAAKQKVADLARIVSGYTGNCVLYVVPYTKPQEYIRDNAPDVLFTVLMRRSMMRIANRVAKEIDAKALVTGESLAQVASQTLMALACTDAAQDLPILRPLIGLDKTEIVEAARRIGTFETSILPYEDCCTIFTPPHPKTKPTLAEIEAAEAAMPGLAGLEETAAREVERIRIEMEPPRRGGALFEL
ncbi:putative tRNA sulfurtransferase [Oscillospiraceae bacterium]|uniref:tRNA uracil 4-sulfurtransferase ThiI n=1 Tax=Allofournierella sp. TaxID=1940256 RepID=UPI0015AB3C1D|nr:putative tRNA sulfurtransferase [Oscillospiraceae bacterium]